MPNSSRKRYIGALLLVIIALGFGLTLGGLTYIIQNSPDISNYKGSSETTMVYSADGELISRLYRENRIYVPLERMPTHLKQAIIAIEDKNFYVHHGIDFWGIARAFATNIMQGRLAQGASTITQQLARNALDLSFEKSFYRKIQEAYLALQFERLYTKTEILEMYLNEISLGHGAHGMEAASQMYFDKSVWELELAESALLAALPRAPYGYSPFQNPEKARTRRNLVLSRMTELGYITEEKAKEAQETDLDIQPSEPEEMDDAPYFLRFVRDELVDRFGSQVVYGGGLKVYTTLDLDMQDDAEESIENAIEEEYIPSVERENSEHLQPQMSVLSLEPDTGAIRAMVGGRGSDEFNRTSQAVRQPGSAFKPFLYTTAINQNLSAGTVINDMPMLSKSEEDEELRIWPTNSGDIYRGFVSLRTALAQSINVASVKLLNMVGIDETVSTTEEMGISTLQSEDGEKDHLSLALGGLNRGVTPLEMASAYGIFANKGIHVKPYAIEKVKDNQDETIYEASSKKDIVLDEDTSYIMTSMLGSVIKNGTGWRANLNRPVAGKTGTTNKYTDAWFVGYTPDLVTSVWIGEDNPREMEYDQKDDDGDYKYSDDDDDPLSLSSAEAARLWGDYMGKAVADMPKSDFERPDNIVTRNIDPITGQLPGEHAPREVNEIFREDNVPEEKEELHEPIETVAIDTESELLATDNCPEDSVEEYYYMEESGIRVGPATIEFEKESENEEVEEEEEDDSKIEGTYIVEDGEPVQKIDLENEMPLIEDMEPEYEMKPEEKCDLHQDVEEEEEEENMMDSIWNFFNDD
ncbi:MAG: penicillin-binding protein 1A [Halanaerobiaceae bacterium]